MKSRYWTVSVAFGLLVFSPGCALLPFNSSRDVTAEYYADRDPSFNRSPASLAPHVATEDELDERREAKLTREIEIGTARAQDQLVVGMNMTDVRAVWGTPREVESAGDPRQGNQRWIYPNGLYRAAGIGTARVVYFEAGQVAGWETWQR